MIVSEIERRLRLLERQKGRGEFAEEWRETRERRKLQKKTRGHLRPPPEDAVVIATAKTRTQAERLACAKMRRDGGVVRFGSIFGNGWVLWDANESLVPDGVRDVHNPKCELGSRAGYQDYRAAVARRARRSGVR